jgi:hypothetical protein
MKPPPIIGDARVLEYAVVGEAVFTDTLCLYVNGVRLGAVPCLAICESFDTDELSLLHCDEEWDIKGIQAWRRSADDVSSVEEVKRRAERYYAGISSKWLKLDVSLEDAEAYKASLMVEVRCSFCKRSMFEIDSLLEGDAGVRICNNCVASFYEEMTKNQSRG